MTRLTVPLLALALSVASLVSHPGRAQSGQTAIAQAAHPYLVVPRTNARTATPWELHLVQTSDEIYVPIGVRKPAGTNG